MLFKSLLAFVAMTISVSALAQNTETWSAKDKKGKPCKNFLCAWNAEIEAQKSKPQTPPEPEQTAFVTVKLDINEQGSVDKCDVLQSTAPQELTDKSCNILLKAKFKPKLDEHGVAQRDTVTQTIQFKLES